MTAGALVHRPPPWPTALLLSNALSLRLKVALLAAPVAEPYQIAPPVPELPRFAA
jgi:hypothetical protein